MTSWAKGGPLRVYGGAPSGATFLPGRSQGWFLYRRCPVLAARTVAPPSRLTGIPTANVMLSGSRAQRGRGSTPSARGVR